MRIFLPESILKAKRTPHTSSTTYSGDRLELGRWQGYIFWFFFSKLKNREDFEGGLHEKRKGKGGIRRRKKKVIKYTLQYLFEA